MDRQWNVETALEMARSFQPAAVLAAAAELDVFTKLADGPRTVEDLTAELGADARAVGILLDALAALRLLDKTADGYTAGAEVARLFSESAPGNLLPAVRHTANCMRNWAQLARVVMTGQPAPRVPSIRGEQADLEAFIGAMNSFSGPIADDVVARLKHLPAAHILDLGGASGTWTIALLKAFPAARATIVDLPDVIPLAQQRIADAGLSDRVAFAAADYLQDPLPRGADFAWLSAILHQHSRPTARRLYEKVHAALTPAGLLAIRDIVMEDSRIEPPAGAMFAVNMLTATENGGTYTFAEYSQDLAAAGFADITLIHKDPWMNSLITARKA